MATGALVFVDYLYVPYSYPLIHKKHIIFYDNNNMNELMNLLDYYRLNKNEARRIAYNGYLFSMKYHRTVNMLDYILRSIVVKSNWEKENNNNKLEKLTNKLMLSSQINPLLFRSKNKLKHNITNTLKQINYKNYTYTAQYLHYIAAKNLAIMSEQNITIDYSNFII